MPIPNRTVLTQDRYLSRTMFRSVTGRSQPAHAPPSGYTGHDRPAVQSPVALVPRPVRRTPVQCTAPNRLSPITPSTIRPTENSLAADAPSPKNSIPKTTVPAAPIPVHTAYAGPISSRLSASVSRPNEPIANTMKPNVKHETSVRSCGPRARSPPLVRLERTVIQTVHPVRGHPVLLCAAVSLFPPLVLQLLPLHRYRRQGLHRS